MIERTAQEKALHTLIHDHAGNSGAIKTALELLQAYVKENNKEKIEYYLNFILERSRNCDGAIDNYYNKFKNNFQDDNNV